LTEGPDASGGGEPEGTPHQPLAVGAKYSGGRRLRGLSAEDGNKIQPSPKRMTSEPEVLTSAQQTLLALELGFPGDSMGFPDPDAPDSLVRREPTDSEALFLQFPGKFPLSFYASVFEGTAPTLFWTDCGKYMTGKNRKEKEHREIVIAWWRALHLGRNPASCEQLVGEPCDLALLCQSFDGIDYDISIPPGAVGTFFQNSPRGVIAAPKIEFDPTKGHRVIAGFGYSQALYFHTLHLIGRLSGGLYSPQALPRMEMKKPPGRH